MEPMVYKEWKEIMSSEDSEFMKLPMEKRMMLYLEYLWRDGKEKSKDE